MARRSAASPKAHELPVLVPAPDLASSKVNKPTPPSHRPRHDRHVHPYRNAALFAMLCFASAVTTWLAAADVLLGIERGTAWLRAQDSDAYRAMVTTGLVALALLALIIAWDRATSPRRPVRLSNGRGRMAVSVIEARLRAEIIADPDVRDADVRVENAHRRGVRVDVHLRVAPQARIDDAIDRVDGAAEDLLEGRLGVSMDGLPVVDVTYDELDLRAGRAHGPGS